MPQGNGDQPPPPAYEEIDKSPAEAVDFTNREFTVTRRFICDWADRYNVIALLLTQDYDPGIQQTLGLRQAQPWRFRIRPMGGLHGFQSEAGYSKAIIEVEYTNKFITQPVRTRVESSIEFVTLPKGNFVWGAPNGPPLKDDELPGIQFRKLVLSIETLSGGIPFALLDLQGRVNAAEFVWNVPPFDWTFPPETLLFTPPVIEPQVPTIVKTNFRLVYQSTGWNRFWRAETDQWEAIYHSGGAEFKQYPPTDFTPLTDFVNGLLAGGTTP